MDHKHCVFCGENSDSKNTVCLSPLNPFKLDTVGNKYHWFPIDYKEKARIAAERARATSPNEIEFITA